MPQNLLSPQPSNTNLFIFSPTADQRYLLGTDVFLRTHFPIKLIEHQEHNLSLPIEENYLQYKDGFNTESKRQPTRKERTHKLCRIGK